MSSSDVIYAWGFSPWKFKHLKRYLAGSVVKKCWHPEAVPVGETLAVWGMAELPLAYLGRVSLLRVEDGFLRSVGLGADLARPLSLVLDRRGMHFDRRQASDLELLLMHTDFSDPLLERARALRHRIVENGITKYNLQGVKWARPPYSSKVILVAGQVETDASIIYGAVGIQHNLDLLKKVRKDNPSAYVIDKAHPDVLAGMRRKGVKEDEAALWCDEILGNVSTEALLSEVDEIHTMTSLVGFEALLRGKTVICYGQPFYAGWGLTTDQAPVERRTRRLVLDELVAGALILYPIYISSAGSRLITPEEALDELSSLKHLRMGTSKWLKEIYRSVLRTFIGVR